MRIPIHMLLRDLALIALCVVLLQFSHRLDAMDHVLSWPVAVLSGLLLAVAGYILHEWGHLISAELAGSVMHYPRSIFAVLLFRYDTARNDRRQFLWMSYGGFIASAIVVPLYYLLLDPAHRADLVALVLTTLGVIAIFIIEVPQAWSIYRGAPLPQGAAFVHEDGKR